MAKRRRSAKQKANDRKLGAMARARGRKSSTKPRKRRSVRNTIKPRKRRSSMVRRRAAPRRSVKGKIINRIPILKNPAVKEIAMGLGMARIVSTVGRRVPIPAIQNNAALLGTAAAFAVDVKAGIVDLALSGGLGAITSLASGGNGGGSAGFA